MRIRVKGRLCVYRESSMVEYLSACLQTENHSYYYPHCPKCFDDVVTGSDNIKNIEVTINNDGSNPRSVKVV